MMCEEYQILIEKYLCGIIEQAQLTNLKDHTKGCARCRKEFSRCKEVQRIIKEGLLPKTAADKARDSILSERAIAAPKVSAMPKEATARVSLWIKILKSGVTKMAAGALIVAGILCGVRRCGTVSVSSVAWGKLPQRIGRIQVVKYRRIDIHPSMRTGGATINERIVYLSSDQGTRVDTYHKGTLSNQYGVTIADEGVKIYKYQDEIPYRRVRIDIQGEHKTVKGKGIAIDKFTGWEMTNNGSQDECENGTLKTKEFYLPALNVNFEIHRRRGEKTGGYCGCWLMKEKPVLRWYRWIDPREWIREAMALDYKELGRKKLDGMQVEGVEIRGCNLGIATLPPGEHDSIVRVWVDIKTGLVVRYEARVRYGEVRGDYGLVADRFQWHEKIEPNTFEPNIPNGYSLASVTIPKDGQDVTITEGSDLLSGLQLFAKLTDGRYPSSMPAAVLEGLQAYREKYGPPATETNEDQVRIAETLGSAALFHADLVCPRGYNGGPKDKDVAYYGYKVTAADVNAVLMRWKISDERYRVVFGDLSTEDVAAEKLAELEMESVRYQ